MGDATTLLFGLDRFRVVSVAQREEDGEGGREVVVEEVEGEQCAGSRTYRTDRDRCTSGGISVGGRADSGPADGARSLRSAGRSGRVSG